MTEKQKSNAQYLQEFNNLLQVRFPDKIQTHITYRSKFKKFLYEFKGNVKKATTPELMQYLSTISISSMNQMHGVLKLFYSHILHQSNKIERITYSKKEKRLPHIPTREQVLKMIELTENTKHKLILSMFFGSGIRLSELAGLKWSDIKREQGINPLSIHVRGKGAKDRMVGLSQHLYDMLFAYCKEYKLKCEHGNYYILGDSKPYSHRSLGKVCTQAGQRIGFNLSPHKLRHACFFELRNAGTDLAAIQEIAGHESLKSTRIYARLIPQKIEMPL